MVGDGVQRVAQRLPRHPPLRRALPAEGAEGPRLLRPDERGDVARAGGAGAGERDRGVLLLPLLVRRQAPDGATAGSVRGVGGGSAVLPDVGERELDEDVGRARERGTDRADVPGGGRGGVHRRHGALHAGGALRAGGGQAAVHRVPPGAVAGEPRDAGEVAWAVEGGGGGGAVAADGAGVRGRGPAGARARRCGGVPAAQGVQGSRADQRGACGARSGLRRSRAGLRGGGGAVVGGGGGAGVRVW